MGRSLPIDAKSGTSSLNGKILIEDKTVVGNGQSYFYEEEKPGYCLASVYCYADEYYSVDVVSFRRNSKSKDYSVVLSKNFDQGASAAIRFIWVKL